MQAQMMKPCGLLMCFSMVIDGGCDFDAQFIHLIIGRRFNTSPGIIGHISIYTNNCADMVREASSRFRAFTLERWVVGTITLPNARNLG